MDPLSIAAVGAPLVGGIIDMIGGNNANAANAEQARLNREFQERMSSTAWQRGVADMKSAGLNPALAYEKGGASSPSGATAHLDNALAGLGSSAGAAVRSYMGTAQAKAQIAQTAAQTQNTEAQTRQLNLESLLQVELLRERIRNMGLSSAKTAQETLTEKQETERRMFARFREGIGYDLDKQTLDHRANMYPQAERQAQLQTDWLTDTLKARIGRELLSTGALGLAMPALRNKSAAADTWWGRHVAPFLGSGSEAVDLFRKLAP